MSSAERVGWGGRTMTHHGIPSPQMGSGYFPDQNFVHAAYFKFISIQDQVRKDLEPDTDMTETLADKPNCFNAQHFGALGRDVGNSLQFGGPGGECGD
ncbi:hypothetical protein DEO72_LG7g2475 [Vigna unguiculata]|uniref:Neprosin PEP catalytic domain-containing protein n=2 Tax=Vigna unguiculata TaxID=3917 RepID=A0A4D6MKI1_VIGUN|nr:hypothetical protein DEO72_LG7g2475 [Vigna unguiculata]